MSGRDSHEPWSSVSPGRQAEILNSEDGGTLLLPGVVSPFDVRMIDGLGNPGTNVTVGSRVIIPRTGVLKHLAIYVGVQHGNIDVGIYTAGSPRVRVFSTGTIACPASNAWAVVGNPQINVVKGQHYDFAIASNDEEAYFGKSGRGGAGDSSLLPDLYKDGQVANALLNWYFLSGPPLAASLTQSNLLVDGYCYAFLALVV